MRRLGRITIFSTAIHEFLKSLKRQHGAVFETVVSTLVERYQVRKGPYLFRHGQAVAEPQDADAGQHRSVRPDPAVQGSSRCPVHEQLKAAPANLGRVVPGPNFPVPIAGSRSNNPGRSLPTRCKTLRTWMPVTARRKPAPKAAIVPGLAFSKSNFGLYWASWPVYWVADRFI